MDILKECTLCPRMCKVNRYINTGFCNATDKIKIAYYTLYKWEEPIISGSNGSGSLFFSNCNLRCIFCQNKKISCEGYGKEVTNERLIEIMMDLQNSGAHNINLVTPTQYVPQLVDIIRQIKNKKLKIPIVYNTSSYENVETIQLLNGCVDIYLADFKYFDNNLGIKYSACKNYFDVVSKAIDEMYKQTGKFIIKNDIMVKGIIVRILILPGHTNDAIKIIDYLFSKYGHNIIFSIMNQYTPIGMQKYNNLNRKLTDEEYDEVINYACNLGIKYAFIQEGETQSESFIPNFDCSII